MINIGDVSKWNPPAQGSKERESWPRSAFLDQANRRYPFKSKDSSGKFVVSEAGLNAARNRAAQQGDVSIFRAATTRLNRIREARGDKPFSMTISGDARKSADFNIYKSDDDKRQVFGWASVAKRANGEVVEDWQGDIIGIDELEKAAYDFTLNYRAAGDNHTQADIGQMIESVVFTKEKAAAMGIPDGAIPEGWWVGFHISDDEAWRMIKSRERLMMSIEGVGQRIPVEGGG